MRVVQCGFVAMIAFTVGSGPLEFRASGDEPVKPTAPASEANPAVPAPGHSVHGEAFNDGPRHAAYLMPGMGKVHFAVTTKKPEAQAFVDQGVGQLHSFYYFEAERSFRQAATIDPDCGMAYWGMAMSNVVNPRRAKGFLKEARKRTAKMSQHELLYLAALESYFQDGAADRARRDGLLRGLETIVQDFPGDIDARAWLAMVTWQNSFGGAGIGSRQAVDTLLDTVLQVEPMHPGAHHYRIHLWDGHKPIRAEKSAALFARSAPGIAHAWHMPGHTYTELKRYADAAYQQEGSARVDHAYMIRDRVMPFEIHNYAHNNQWLCTSLSHIGRVRDAIAVARNLVEQPRDPSKNGPNDGGSPQRSGRSRWSELLTRYELWDDLIDATTSGALDWSSIPYEQEQKAYTLGQAYAAKNDQGKLAAQVEILRKLTTPGAKAALAELEGYSLLWPRRDRPGVRAVWQGEFDADRSPGPSTPGGSQLRFRRKHRSAGGSQEPQPGPACGRSGRNPPRRGQGQGSSRRVSFARRDRPLGRPRRAGLSPHRADRRPMEGRGHLDGVTSPTGQHGRHRRDGR